MTCSFCRHQSPHLVIGKDARICQPCTAKAVGEFARAYHDRTDIAHRGDPTQGVGDFHADHPSPLMAG